MTRSTACRRPAAMFGRASRLVFVGVIIGCLGDALLGTSAFAQVTPPPGAIRLLPSDDIQAFVDANMPGTAFVLAPGVYGMQTIRPKAGNSFTGESGAVLNGARLLTGFKRTKGYWVASGQTQQGRSNLLGLCEVGFPRCTYPEELFIDNVRLRHVAQLSDVVAGTWYFDYDADQIYISSNPAGHTVETSITPAAFQPTADNVTVQGLTVVKYANVAQQGAIGGQGRTGWIVQGNTVGWNHAVAIYVGSNSQVINNNILQNGQLGIGANGDNVLVQGNEIAANNQAGYWPTWEAGGAKFTFTTNLVLRGNYVHQNLGPGLWLDEDTVNTLIENNTADDNARAGIFMEIGYTAVIRNNTARRNGFDSADYLWGGGIVIAASPDVEIYGNLLDGNADGICAVQQARGTGPYGPHEMWNLWVHDNSIMNTPGYTGLGTDIGDDSYFTSKNNRFDRNHYVLGTTQFPFAWMNSERTEIEWVQFGQDTNGSFSR